LIVEEFCQLPTRKSLYMFRLFYSDFSASKLDPILKKVKSMGLRSIEFIPEVVKLIQTKREADQKHHQSTRSSDFIIDFILPMLINGNYDDAQSIVWFQAME